MPITGMLMIRRVYGLMTYSAILLLFLAGIISSQENGTVKNNLSITAPRQMNDGWLIGNLKDSKIDSIRLYNLLKRINEREYPGIDGLLIVKEGKLVFEKYFQGYDYKYSAIDYKGKLTDYDCETQHNLASVTKSVTSLLCGIALDKGFIKSVDDQIFSFFPQDSSLFSGDKKKITLQHLLTMTSGLKWNEWELPYGNMKNDAVQLFLVPDPIKYIFSKPLADEPGTKWYYNGGSTDLIGQIIQRSSGLRLDQFAQKYLFDPLEIKNPKWVFINHDFVDASGDLMLRPRDMAKLGLLVLNNGIWKGNIILSSGWIGQMTKKWISLPKEDCYGYQWWLQTYKLGSGSVDSYHASGWGGQQIIILPGLSAVLIITGNNYTGTDPTNDMVFNYLLPALKKNFTYDFDKIQKEAPLPDSTKIVKPGNLGDAGAAAISGHWCGQWDAHFLSCQLLVERIENGEATVVYSWAAHPSGYFKKGWVRKKVRMESSVEIKFETADKLEFRFDPDEDVIIGNLKNDFVTSKAILRRVE
jgi:CubicO group peptidase (beta-lactamase class C family)